ncbi:MAG: TIGR02679 family protein [Dermatophilaceae bacterium]
MRDLPAWITDPELAPAWERIRLRFENAGLVAQGAVIVPLASRDERQAIGALLGRTLTSDRIRVDLADLDTRLRERSGVGGVEAVLTRLAGRAPQNRPALRAARDDARERPLAVASELVDAAWARDWIVGLRRTGLLTNRDQAERIVRDAARVLIDLTDPDRAPRAQSRVELGARLLGDAHALDRDRLVHQVVLRGLAAAAGVPVPDESGQRGELWASFGVEPDLLSRTCLVWGLRIDGDNPVGKRLSVAADAGDPVHVTEWDLRRVADFRPVSGAQVLVCENPRVVEAMAEERLSGWSGVCTSGMPNLVVDRILTALDTGGATLFYHGDFDWPGLAIANRAIANYAVRPWRMTAQDYLAAVRADGPELVGRPVEPAWDVELGEAMRRHGRAVHEESVLTGLLDALSDPTDHAIS